MLPTEPLDLTVATTLLTSVAANLYQLWRGRKTKSSLKLAETTLDEIKEAIIVNELLDSGSWVLLRQKDPS